jgi:hypothetical protein
LYRNDEEIETLKQKIIEDTEKLTRLQKDRTELSGQINLTLSRLYDLCIKLKEADNAPVPDKCPSIEKADWLICLLQTKYEKVIRNAGVVDKNQRNSNEKVKNNVPINYSYSYF